MPRNPKVAKFTDEQEAELSQTEAIMTRSRIIERGVAAILNVADYFSAGDIEVAATMLNESVALRKDAETRRAEIRRIELEANPQRSKVRVVSDPVRGKVRR